MKKILIVIDLQKDFAYPEGALSNSFCEEAARKAAKYIEESDANILFYTLDTHEENYLETLEGKNLPVVHCIDGSEGHKLTPEIQIAINKFVESGERHAIEIKKNTFGYQHWYDQLRNIVDPDTVIEIFGVCTAICVASNATIIRAAFPNTEIRVIKDLCACVSYPSHKSALKTMEMQQIKVV